MSPGGRWAATAIHVTGRVADAKGLTTTQSELRRRVRLTARSSVFEHRLLQRLPCRFLASRLQFHPAHAETNLCQHPQRKPGPRQREGKSSLCAESVEVKVEFAGRILLVLLVFGHAVRVDAVRA